MIGNFDSITGKPTKFYTKLDVPYFKNNDNKGYTTFQVDKDVTENPNGAVTGQSVQDENFVSCADFDSNEVNSGESIFVGTESNETFTGNDAKCPGDKVMTGFDGALTTIQCRAINNLK